ncbi:hypothetical protein TNIN_320571 [Trichonephila inaurata madagascariensis]|uniref:Uncharacterized protein n=1 Tax=Trichonephila inaurata madagascariensis TaxID=2747483 RepID=A0A8X7CF54_9ARAC|nr:hypothetical protein TNIN_320571 [Trichonephila inaurata madagascariensis]
MAKRRNEKNKGELKGRRSERDSSNSYAWNNLAKEQKKRQPKLHYLANTERADSELEPMRGVRELSDKVQIKYLATLLGKKKP